MTTRADILKLIRDPEWPYFTATVDALGQGASGEKIGIEVLNLFRWHERNRRTDDQRDRDAKHQ